MSKYVRDKAHCKHEADFYSKEEVDVMLTDMHNDLVKPNEVYFKGDFVECTGSITVTAGNTGGGTSITLPEGFTYANYRVLSTWYEYDAAALDSLGLGYSTRYTNNKLAVQITTSDKYSVLERVSVSLAVDETRETDVTYNVGVIFLKIS